MSNLTRSDSTARTYKKVHRVYVDKECFEEDDEYECYDVYKDEYEDEGFCNNERCDDGEGYIASDENCLKMYKWLIDNNYDPITHKQFMQIVIPSWDKAFNVIEIHKCVETNELIISIVKTGDVHIVKITPELKLNDVIGFILSGTPAFINDPNKFKFEMIEPDDIFEIKAETSEELLNTLVNEIKLAQGNLVLDVDVDVDDEESRTWYRVRD